MTKSELRDYIKRQFGYPYVKVELSNEHLDDSIDQAKAMWTKWATGEATKEVFLTKVLSGGERNIKLPNGIYEVVSINDSTQNLGSANQLFTLQNQMMNAGLLNFLQTGNASLLDYHIGLDYLDALDKYTVSSYHWVYHKYNNTLTLSPVPSAGVNWTNNDTNFVLIRAYIKDGFYIDGTNEENTYNQYVYDEPWFKEYSTALSKIKLGYIRRKFANGPVMGNTTISLDGDQLVSEGQEEKRDLEQQLKDGEGEDQGWGIYIS